MRTLQIVLIASGLAFWLGVAVRSLFEYRSTGRG